VKVPVGTEAPGPHLREDPRKKILQCRQKTFNLSSKKKNGEEGKGK